MLFSGMVYQHINKAAYYPLKWLEIVGLSGCGCNRVLKICARRRLTCFAEIELSPDLTGQSGEKHKNRQAI